MTMVDINGKKFSMDGLLIKGLKKEMSLIRKDWDRVFIIDGIVGAGKSVFAQQCAWYCSNGKITLDQICFTPEDFKKAVINADKYDCVVFDEAFRGLSARGAMTQVNKLLVELFTEMRQKNLLCFVVLPSIWDLDGYLSKHRANGLFNIHVDKDYNRGYFKYYKHRVIQQYLANSKIRYSYPPLKDRTIYGRFTNFYPIDEKKYRQKKYDALKYRETKQKTDNKIDQRFKAILYGVKKKYNLTGEQISEILHQYCEFPLNIRRINTLIAEYARDTNFEALALGHNNDFNMSSRDKQKKANQPPKMRGSSLD